MRSEKDKQGFMLIGGVLVVGLVLFALKLRADSQAKPGPDNCVGAPTTNTVIVLDNTDRVSEQTVAEIRARAVSFVRDSVPDNGRVTVFTVSDLSQQSLKPILSMCRPRERGNRLTENTRMLEKNFRQRFEAPLDLAVSVRPEESPR